MAPVSVKDQLLDDLNRSARLRRRTTEDLEFHRRRLVFRLWQGGRLARTHIDLVFEPRFSAAAKFFLGDLYGPTDIGAHIDDIRRVVPVMVRTLPESGLATVARAVELNALSEDLDGAMLEVIGEAVDHLDNAAYAAAYAAVGRREDRRRQLDLIADLGAALDRLTHVRFIGAALKLMHKPAHLAGLGELQDFLERGYEAFGKMRGGAGEFVSIVMARERALSDALINGDARALPPERL